MAIDKNSFEERRRALEEAFFQKQEAELLEKMRKEAAVAALADASGIADQKVLEALVGAGVTASTIAALSLIPLVFVAWADRLMDDRERQAVLKAAAGSGVGPDSGARALVERWLNERPPSSLFDAWSKSIEATVQQLPREEVARLRADIVERARQVAAAAGGFLGIGAISAVERETIERIEKAFG